MSLVSLEAEFLRNLAPELEAEGYEIFLRPQPPILPPFFGQLRPDAIAMGKGRNIIIELVSRQSAQDHKTQELAGLVREHPDWDLRVFVVSPLAQGTVLERQSLPVIRAAFGEIRRLSEEEHYSAALLMAWGAFEAFARWYEPATFQTPQTPGRVVQILAQDGVVTPSEADRLRVLAAKRNGLIHGSLGTQVDKSDIEFFLLLLEMVVGSVQRN